MEEYFKPYAEGLKEWSPPAEHAVSKLPMAPWLCQVFFFSNYLKGNELDNVFSGSHMSGHHLKNT